MQTSGKIALPQSYVNAQTLVFHIESDSFSPLIRRGAYVGVDTSRAHPISGEVYAVYMPHEAWRSNACSSTAIMTVSS